MTVRSGCLSPSDYRQKKTTVYSAGSAVRWNPLKKCGHMQGQDEAFRFAAALSVLLMGEKIRDDSLDAPHLFGGFAAGFLLLITRRARKKAEADEPELAAMARQMTDAQRAAEQQETPLPDECADPHGKAPAICIWQGGSG